MSLSRRNMIALTGSMALLPVLSGPAAAIISASQNNVDALAGPLTDLSTHMRTLLNAFGEADEYWDYSYRQLLMTIADPSDHPIVDCGCPMVSAHEREPFLNLIEAAQDVLAATPKTADDRRGQTAAAAFLHGARIGYSQFRGPKLYVASDSPYDKFHFPERLERYGTDLIPATTESALLSESPCPGDHRCPNGGVEAELERDRQYSWT